MLNVFEDIVDVLNDKLDIKPDASPTLNDEQTPKAKDQLTVIKNAIDDTSISPPTTKSIYKKTRIVTRTRVKPKITPQNSTKLLRIIMITQM